jgi:hypothetical protein
MSILPGESVAFARPGSLLESVRQILRRIEEDEHERNLPLPIKLHKPRSSTGDDGSIGYRLLPTTEELFILNSNLG